MNPCYYHPRFTDEVTEAQKVAELMILTEIPEQRVADCSKHRRDGRSGCRPCQLERGKLFLGGFHQGWDGLRAQCGTCVDLTSQARMEDPTML